MSSATCAEPRPAPGRRRIGCPEARTAPRPDPGRRRIGFLESLATIGIVIFVAARWLPVEGLPFWRCGVRELTGWPCLGCGLTRAAQHLVRGEPLAALAINPLGTILFAALAATIVASAAHLLFGVAPPRWRPGPRGARALRLGLLVTVALNYAWVAWHEVGVLG